MTESHGNMGYARGFEYVRTGAGVYRADYTNPLTTDGYRQGLHFYCPFASWRYSPAYGTLADQNGKPKR